LGGFKREVIDESHLVKQWVTDPGSVAGFGGRRSSPGCDLRRWTGRLMNNSIDFIPASLKTYTYPPVIRILVTKG
jgi:hypothetical protein